MNPIANNLHLHIYTGNRILIPHTETIQTVFTKTILTVNKLLPIHDIDIDIYTGELRYAPEAGIIGHTENLHHISIAVMPDHPRFLTIISSDLFGILAHELYHVSRWRTRGLDKTLLDSLISEGLAGHFETEITHQDPSLCFRELTDKEVVALMPQAEKEFHKTDYNHYDWFTGSKEKNIPHWAGYGIGFYITEQFFKKHPEETSSSVYMKTSETFL